MLTKQWPLWLDWIILVFSKPSSSSDPKYTANIYIYIYIVFQLQLKVSCLLNLDKIISSNDNTCEMETVLLSLFSFG